MSVIEKLFHHSRSAAPPTIAPAPADERHTLGMNKDAPIEDVSGYLDGGDSVSHHPGEPPHWAPECGTPTFSTRHRCGI